MRILITGAAGFIGSHLGNRLVELGHEVVGVDNLGNYCNQHRDFRLVTADFRQIFELEPKPFDAIYHLAARINVDESIETPAFYFQENANGTLFLLEHLRQAKSTTKFIYASSAEVYGTARHQKMDEGHPLDPQSPYAVSKLAAEQLCKNYAQLYAMPITVVRNFNTFGEHQRGGRYGGVIAKFKGQAMRGEPITVYGSGEQMRDYMHISQAVAGYVLALETSLPLIVNFGSGTPIRIIDIANAIAKRFNAKVTHTPNRPGEIMRLEADIGRAEAYGYRAETDFWKHLDYYLSHPTA